MMGVSIQRSRHRRWLCVGLVFSLSAFALQGAAAVTVASAASSATPNRFDPTARSSSTRPAPAAKPAPTSGSTRTTGPVHRKLPTAAAAPPATVALDPTRPSHLGSSDGSLELDVPA